MGSNVKNIEGYESRGGDTPGLDPNKVFIVGLDEPETPENWFAHCTRLRDISDGDLEDYLAEVRLTGRVQKIVDVYADGYRRGVLDGRTTTRVARMYRAEQVKNGVAAGDLIRIRVRTHEGTPEDFYRINTSSHKQRPLTKMQEARQYLTYFTRHEEDHAKTALFFGVTAQTVKNQIAVFGLDERLHEHIDSGKLPVSQAIKLVDKPRAEQWASYQKMEAEGALKGVAASNAIAALKRGEPVGKADRTKVRPRAFLESLHKVAKREGTVVRIPLADLLKFILGGPPPEGLKADLLEKAGFKSAVKKEKKG